MPDNVKFTVVERNGTELEFQEEEDFLPENMPFSDPSFTADNVKDAILETPMITGISRFAVICGYDATSNNGRWMEFHRGNPSDSSPFILAEDAELISASVSIADNEDGSTYTIYKNGTALETIVISLNPGATNKAYKVFPTVISCVAGDEISVQQTTPPSTTEPTLTLFFRVIQQ